MKKYLLIILLLLLVAPPADAVFFLPCTNCNFKGPAYVSTKPSKAVNPTSLPPGQTWEQYKANLPLFPTFSPTDWSKYENLSKPQVKGTTTALPTIPSADRKAADFIKNELVPSTVDKVYFEVFGHKIIPQLSTYWKARARSDKATVSKLRGAMQFHKSKGMAGPGWVLVY